MAAGSERLRSRFRTALQAVSALTLAAPGTRLEAVPEGSLTEARIDLHTHTSHSEDRIELSLPHGASAVLPFNPVLSPCAAYDLALSRGMTHVTFTDHDTVAGCLELLERHPSPDRFLWGEEVSCHHQGVSVHVGVYGLTEDDHRALHAGSDADEPARHCLRWNLPELLAYCADRGLVCDLKHPLFNFRGQAATREQYTSLYALFPLVEAINGTRHRWLNDLGAALAKVLGPAQVAFTGGSDSHTDCIGQTYTRTAGQTVDDVLDSLRAGRAEAVGQHGSHSELERDTLMLIGTNVTERAGPFAVLLDDQTSRLPTLAGELLKLLTTGALAYGVVSEFAHQRRLAREVEALFCAALERGNADAEPLVAPAASGPVHGHVRRD